MRPDDVITAWLARFPHRRDRGATDAQPAQPDRAAALGALGEAMVAGVLRDAGWPALRNVVLHEGDASAEIDVLARAPNGIVVLEAKTWSGFIDGTAGAAEWTRFGAGGREASMPNAVRQNAAHVGMVEQTIGDRDVSVRGLVVGAGHAHFAAPLRSHIVPLAELAEVLQALATRPRLHNPHSLDRAWTLLAREAERSASRREAHAARVKSRRGDGQNCD